MHTHNISLSEEIRQLICGLPLLSGAMKWCQLPPSHAALFQNVVEGLEYLMTVYRYVATLLG